MKPSHLNLLILASILGGCSYPAMNQNPNRKRSPERVAYETCMRKNVDDQSKCKKELDDLRERQQVELMDEDS